MGTFYNSVCAIYIYIYIHDEVRFFCCVKQPSVKLFFIDATSRSFEENAFIRFEAAAGN